MRACFERIARTLDYTVVGQRCDVSRFVQSRLVNRSHDKNPTRRKRGAFKKELFAPIDECEDLVTELTLHKKRPQAY